MLDMEGQVRIPSGCAISGIISRSGKSIPGSEIIKSISVMHDRSNGLGGGFAGYGIYPQYEDLYALHVFYYNSKAKELTEEFLNKHFEVGYLSNIATRKNPNITDEPTIICAILINQFAKQTEWQFARRKERIRCTMRNENKQPV